MSAILISAVLMGIMATLCTGSFFARFDSLSREYRRVAQGFAESCAQVALLDIAQNYTYDLVTDPAYVAGRGVRVSIGIDAQGAQEVCYIRSIIYMVDTLDHQETAIITTQGQYQDSFAGEQVEATIADPAFAPVRLGPTVSIVSWTQVP